MRLHDEDVTGVRAALRGIGLVVALAAAVAAVGLVLSFVLPLVVA